MRDPKTGRFMPSSPLSGRAADMLLAFEAGRAEARLGRHSWLSWVFVGVTVDGAFQFIVRAVWP